MDDFLQEERFNFISDRDKAFIRDFNREITQLGYDYGGVIGSGYCWGRYMLIYQKSGVKSKNVYARIYIRDTSIALRLFLNGIDKHRPFIENAPAHIRDAFTGPFGDCRYDRVDPDGGCKFRKTYTIDGRLIEKCNGETFEFRNPSQYGVEDYLALFTEFFPHRKRAFKVPEPV